MPGRFRDCVPGKDIADIGLSSRLLSSDCTLYICNHRLADKRFDAAVVRFFLLALLGLHGL